MNRLHIRAMAAAVGLFSVIPAAQAQVLWDALCFDEIQTPYSDDYSTRPLQGSLFGVTLGLGGTTTISKRCSGTTGDVQIANAGGIGFSGGPVGSVQSSADDWLRMNWGMPRTVGGDIGYAVLVTADATGGGVTKSRIAGYSTVYYLASDRAHFSEGFLDNVRVTLRIDQVGDAARLNWKLANLGDAGRQVGLQFAQAVEFLNSGAQSGPAAYVYLPGSRPLRTPRSFTVGGQNEMPEYVAFSNSRENGYGLRIQNKATEGQDSPFADLTPVDELKIGQAYIGGTGGLLGNVPWGTSTMPEFQLDDAFFTDFDEQQYFDVAGAFTSNTGYLQKWYPVGLNTNQTREINAYYRTTWSNSSYAKPYAVVVDAPNVVAVDPNDPSRFLDVYYPADFAKGTPEVVGHKIRVYVDNIRGYTTVDQEIPLEDVRLTLSFPQGGVLPLDASGNQVGSGTITKYIASIGPKAVDYVDFPISVLDGTNGMTPYRISITTRTAANRVVDGAINVAAQPRLTLRQGPNLVSTPYNYQNNNWSNILGLRVDLDFRAFTWDPQQNEYVIQTGPQRGSATWLITDQDRGNIELQGNPRVPTDMDTGAPLFTLKQGWNLISNPYPYRVPLGQLVGVSSTTPDTTLTYRQLVESGVISGALAYYDTSLATPEYVYITDLNESLKPNVGYWIYVQTEQDVTISFPPVLEPFVPDAPDVFAIGKSFGRAPNTGSNWSLQLAGRSQSGKVDGRNFVGITNSTKELAKNAAEAPMSPEKNALSVSIVGQAGKRTAAMARAVRLGAGRQVFDVEVRSRNGGVVTLTWPNLMQMPRDWSYQLVDPATGTKVDLRRGRNLQVATQAGAVKRLQLVAQPGTVSSALVGDIKTAQRNVLGGKVTQIDFATAAPVNLTVRVLSSTGAEVAGLRRNSPVNAGPQKLVWGNRDAANRPLKGSYTIEVTGRTRDGRSETRTATVSL